MNVIVKNCKKIFFSHITLLNCIIKIYTWYFGVFANQCTLYEDLYTFITQYGSIIFWKGCIENARRLLIYLIVQQNLAVRMCSKKKNRRSLNYKTLKVLLAKVFYKVFAILNVSNQTIIKRENKRDPEPTTLVYGTQINNLDRGLLITWGQ